MNEKLTPEHLARTAYVYVRQSTAQQVRQHREGQQRQYELATRARQLGFARVVVIDEDLGKSGSGLVERPGFGQLLTAICHCEAGAVLALEASRLARNNRDWHHLLDLCAMTGTLLIDDRGVYDPRQINDRLLLGLQGTIRRPRQPLVYTMRPPLVRSRTLTVAERFSSTTKLSRTDKRRALRQTINEAKDLRRPKTRRLSVSA